MLPSGGDWREFCATTPAHFYDMEFIGAHNCFQYVGLVFTPFIIVHTTFISTEPGYLRALGNQR